MSLVCFTESINTRLMYVIKPVKQGDYDYSIFVFLIWGGVGSSSKLAFKS